MVTKNNVLVSKYKGKLTPKNVIENIAKIKIAFPSLPVQFYDLLSRRIKEKSFSDEQLTDAVNHVIDTCIYPTPTIAQFLSYDAKIEMFTHQQIQRMINDNIDIMKYYTSVNVDGRMFYVSNEDFEKYKLKKWIPKKK